MKTALNIVWLVVGICFVGVLILGGVIGIAIYKQITAEKQITMVEPYWDKETGFAVKDDTSTPRFANEWLPEYLEKNGYTVVNNQTWYQAKKGNVVVSWGEWGLGSKLGNVDGVTVGKYLFIQTREKQDWVDTSSVNHNRCAGSFVQYAAEMSDWDIPNSTIVQFDGPADEINTLVDDFSKSWIKVRMDLAGCTP